jgi:hypothetical protein
MRGAIPQLPQYDFMAWCLVKHRDNFTLLLSVKNKVCYEMLHRPGSGSGSGLVTGCCDYGNEPSGSIKGAEILGRLCVCVCVCVCVPLTNFQPTERVTFMLR